jgi:hypothetical protein
MAHHFPPCCNHPCRSPRHFPSPYHNPKTKRNQAQNQNSKKPESTNTCAYTDDGVLGRSPRRRCSSAPAASSPLDGCPPVTEKQALPKVRTLTSLPRRCVISGRKDASAPRTAQAAQPSATLRRDFPINPGIVVKTLLRKALSSRTLHRSAASPSASRTALLPVPQREVRPTIATAAKTKLRKAWPGSAAFAQLAPSLYHPAHLSADHCPPTAGLGAVVLLSHGGANDDPTSC